MPARGNPHPDHPPAPRTHPPAISGVRFCPPGGGLSSLPNPVSPHRGRQRGEVRPEAGHRTEATGGRRRPTATERETGGPAAVEEGEQTRPEPRSRAGTATLLGFRAPAVVAGRQP